MGVFDDVLEEGKSLIKNDNALDYEFLPKNIPFRENEQEHIATCVKPLFNGRSGRNLLIYGAPGIGKTAAARHVLKELEGKTDKIYPIYINCWQHNTTYKILNEICNILGYKFTQNKKTVELFQKVKSWINKKKAVFVFDEIDKVDDQDFLYFVLEDIHKKSVFLITNYKEWITNLDERIKSRLVPEQLEFKAYNKKETRGILDNRLDYAFVPGVWEDDAFELVVDKAYELRDIRSGLFLLREAALSAEDEAKTQIEKRDVKTAIDKLDDFTIKDSDTLEGEMKIIYDIVKEHSGEKIGDLYDIYEENGGEKSYKTFQRKIKELSEGDFINTKKQTGEGGNTTIVEKTLDDFTD